MTQSKESNNLEKNKETSIEKKKMLELAKELKERGIKEKDLDELLDSMKP